MDKLLLIAKGMLQNLALFPIQVGKSFCYFNFKMAFRFLHRKNRNAAKRFGNPPPHKAPEDWKGVEFRLRLSGCAVTS